MDKIYKNEVGYIDLLRNTAKYGKVVTDRTGIGRKVLLSQSLSFDTHCLSTIRPLPLRFAFEEMWFWLNGKTQTKELEDKGIMFWKGNTSRSFLDSRGLDYLDEGELGSAYSLAWRNSGGYDILESKKQNRSVASSGVDQLRLLVDELTHNKYSSRNVVTLYNPSEVNNGALPPCWFGSVWNILPDENGIDCLHVHLLNRSCDLLFGSQMAISQYKILQLALCELLGYGEGKVDTTLINAHIYLNQLDYVTETIGRELGTQGRITITKELNTLDDLLGMTWDDISVDGLVVNTTPFNTIRPPMAV